MTKSERGHGEQGGRSETPATPAAADSEPSELRLKLMMHRRRVQQRAGSAGEAAAPSREEKGGGKPKGKDPGGAFITNDPKYTPEVLKGMGYVYKGVQSGH